MKYARKRDVNERSIVLALRAAGAVVHQLDGAGIPDLLVGINGRTVLIEVKQPSKADGTAHVRTAQGGEGELTAAQVVFWRDWRGGPLVVAHDVGEAMAAVREP